MSRVAPTSVALAAMVALLGACDGAATEPAAVPVAADCVTAVVSSDYASTSVSLLRADGTLCADNVIHSGSAAVGVVTALSGDVVLPSAPSLTGDIVLVDRYPNAVVTVVSVASGEARVTRQIPVGTGFAANPHDVLFLSPTRAYVSRYTTNGDPTRDPDDLDDGGDLLIVDPTTGAHLGRVDLSAEAGLVDGVRVDPRPDRMVAVQGRVWVALGNLSRRFDSAAAGVVVAVDPDTDSVVGRVPLGDLRNCGVSVARAASAGGFWVSCVGLFAGGDAAAQRAHAGLAYVTVDPAGEGALGLIVGAADLAGGRIPGWGLATDGEDGVWVTVFGDTEGAPDRLLRVERRTGEVVDTGVVSGGFALTAVLTDAERGLLLVADADRMAPHVHRFAVDGTALAPLPPTEASPATGLEPRHLGRFR